MSYINLTDMVEEDAADLQFPKDISSNDINNVTANTSTNSNYDPCNKNLNLNKLESLLSSSEIIHNQKCYFCHNFVKEPYIKCAESECSTILCLKCFSIGVETSQHSNTHSYLIIHDNIRIFPNTNWTAGEEKLFLYLIQTCGLGNWDDISKILKTHTAKECREHYFQYYFDGIFNKLLGLTNFVYYRQPIPYYCNMKSIDPPRYNIDDAINFKNMSGYRAARGDFDTPYDNSAEHLITQLDDELLEDISNDSDNKNLKYCFEELYCGIINAYNNRLKERYRRYKIMKDHGLLVINRNHAYLQKYCEALNLSQNSNKLNETGRFISFIQITNPIAFDSLVESLQLFADYKKYLLKLYNLRKNGIKTFNGAKIYNKLKYKRLFKMRNKRSEQYDDLMTDWKHLGSNIDQLKNNDEKQILLPNPFNLIQKRRKAAPLDIIELPGYSQLTDGEKDLCSRARMTPLAYQEYKEIFRRENIKLGGLKLADARKLIKIDVNKIRQLYDFLLENGFINKSYSAK